jgi:hypothetical protein
MGAAVYYRPIECTWRIAYCVKMSMEALRATTTREREIYRDIERERHTQIPKNPNHDHSTQQGSYTVIPSEREGSRQRGERERANTDTSHDLASPSPRVGDTPPVPGVPQHRAAPRVMVGKGLAQT